MRKMPDGGMFPIDPSVFVKEIPLDLLNVRRVMAPPDAFGAFGGFGGRGGYGGGSGYGGGYGSRGGGSSKPTTVIKKTWRR